MKIFREEYLKGESVKNITIGFMFTIMTFNFLWLQYILPTIAAVLLYIGFRDIRKEDKNLNTAWIFSVINLVLHILNLIYVSTPLNINSNNIGMMVVISTTFQIAFLIIFRKGIKNIFNKEDIILKKDPILRIIIWRIIVVMLAISGLGQIWIISLPIIIYYFYIFRSLYKLSYEFKDNNYINENRVQGFNKNQLLLIYGITCTFIVGICCIFSNHIKLNSNEVISVNEFATRNMLIDKGVSVEIVKDIADEDISNLKNIVNVEVFKDNLIFNSMVNDIGSIFDPHSNNKARGRELEVTSIFIELKGNEMYAIEYFNWKKEGPYWQDGFAVSNTWPLELINGRLLYEVENTNYYAKIPRLRGGLVTSNDIFGYERQENKITGVMNYPSKSKEQRGYVFYKIHIQEGTIAGSNIVDYVHYNHPFRIPYEEVEKKSLMFSDNLRQHATNFRTKSAIELMNN